MPTTDNENKMIKVTVSFFTDDIGSGGSVEPKSGWTQGSVYLVANKLHGIRSEAPKMFNSLSEIGPAIEELLKEHGVSLRAPRSV